MPINPYNNGQVPQAPFGDVFAVRTPKTDIAVARLAQQEWQSRQYQEQQKLAQAAALDKDFDRQLAGIRDADIEDVATAYTDYKNKKKDILFNPAYKKDPVARAKAEAEANKAAANYYATVQGSKQTVDFDKKINAGMIKKPYDYKDGAEDLLNEANKLSTRERNLRGLNNGEAWMEQDENLSPIEKLARGKDRTNTVLIDDAANGGLTRRSMNYTAPNEPRAYQQAWLNGLATKRSQGTLVRDFEHNVTDAQFAAAETEYNNALLDKPRWKTWGVDPQPIDYDRTNPVAKAVAYKTYRHFLDNNPAGKEVQTDNKDKIIDKNFANRLKAMAIGQKYKKEMADYREAIKKEATAEELVWAEEVSKAYSTGDDEKLSAGIQKLWAGNKKGSKMVSAHKDPATGDLEIIYTVPVKDPATFKVEDKPQTVIMKKDDPLNEYKFTKLQGDVLGISGKALRKVTTKGLGTPKTETPKPAKTPKKTKFKGVPQGGF